MSSYIVIYYDIIVMYSNRFFLEMSHNQKSTKLEWVIIILIAAELVIGIAGLGTTFFIK
jgi:uncharacterized Rmd1/YagE family protein